MISSVENNPQTNFNCYILEQWGGITLHKQFILIIFWHSATNYVLILQNLQQM